VVLDTTHMPFAAVVEAMADVVRARGGVDAL